MHPESGGQAAELEVAQVHDRRPLAHAADDARLARRAAAARRGTGRRRIVTNDRVLDRDGDAVVDQAADGVEPALPGRRRNRPRTSDRG